MLASNIRTFFSIILLLLIIASAYIIYDYYKYPVKKLENDIQLITKLNTTTLAPKLKNIVEKQPPPGNWAIIQINKNQLHMFVNIKSKYWLSKLIPVYKSIHKILDNKMPIPDGHYLLSLEDGVTKNLDWPILAFASTPELVNNSAVILMPDYVALDDYTPLFSKLDLAMQQHTWDKKITKIFWRGSATGGNPKMDIHSNFPRKDFINYAQHLDFVDAGFNYFPNSLNYDVVKYLSSKATFKQAVTPEKSLAYKYLIDIDGHSCSYSRVAWILYSNSLLLKHASNNIQWYYDKLKAGEHYIPIAKDFSDLQAKFMWLEANPEQAQRISNNAHYLAKEIFSPENILAATHNALIKYNATVDATLAQSPPIVSPSP